jgi:ABC-type phosphate/phosphonate transport system substrate-binding protein
MKPISLLLLLTGGAGCTTSVAATQEPVGARPITFLSIVQDEDAAAADMRLKRFLELAVANGMKDERVVRFGQEKMSYSEVIRRFAEHEEREPGKAYLARITPYAYVAAEMLGARLNILGIYRSAATGQTTYKSYFVVRKDSLAQYSDWRPDDGGATLEHVKAYLLKRARQAPARFAYHDRFSTSSYFLPSLYFKSNNILALDNSSNPNVIPIKVARSATTSSTDLVDQVWRREVELAAVWDGTMEKFRNPDASHTDRQQVFEDVVFIPNPLFLPNDFLVASGLGPTTEALITHAIKDHPEAGRICTDREEPLWRRTGTARERVRCSTIDEDDRPRDDFDAWYVWDSNDSEVSDTARKALARLRQDARQSPMPVVVKVEARGEGVLDRYVNAVKEAIRLSGTEFVLADADLHVHVDMTWTLESTHDGALTLTSTLDSFGALADRYSNTFSISFVDKNDLPQRIADLVRSRMPRIRYLWPYEEKYPAVLRDLDFTPDEHVLVQRLKWLDPKRNEYEKEMPFPAFIENNTDLSRFRLTDEIGFPKTADGSFNFDPLSNVAYRVVVARKPQPDRVLVALPYCFIGLFGLACVGLLLDLRRRQPPPKGLLETYKRMVEAYHRRWRDKEIEEGEIVWCDLDYMEEAVKEIKAEGCFLDDVRNGGYDFNIGPIPVRLSFLVRLGSRLGGRRGQDLMGPRDAGAVTALDTLINCLVRRDRLSMFVGFPEHGRGGSTAPAQLTEWAALNDIASRHFHSLGICDKPVHADFGAMSSGLSSVVSSHFRSVLKSATREISLFRQTWVVREPDATGRLVHQCELRSALQLRDPNGHAQVNNVTLEVKLPAGAALSHAASESTLQAWVLGKILDWKLESGALKLNLKPIAILKDYADQQ